MAVQERVEPIYLTASYRDREQVKALGARWDAERRQWYVPTGRDLAPFSAWLPTGAAPASTAIAPLAPPTTDVALGPKGVSLSALLSGVARAVAQAHAAGVWTRVEVLTGSRH